MCVLFEFRHFILTLRTCQRISKFLVDLCDEMSLSDYYNINWKSAFAQMASKRKRFGFLN